MGASENSIRKAVHSITSPKQIEGYRTNGLSISHVRVNSVEGILEDRDYPYSGQEVVRADFSYEYSDKLGTNDASGKIEVRTESNIFILKKETGTAPKDRIINQIEHTLDNMIDSKISLYNKIRSNIQDTWEFVLEAEGKDNLVLEKGSKSERFNSLIESGKSGKEIADEYLVVSGDLRFRTHTGSLVPVKYDEGKISIRSQNREDFEYVIQLFESILIDEN
ncbi:MAG: hypothetical protein ABEI13_00420 [Candidatus Paceibacteria bacterium]